MKFEIEIPDSTLEKIVETAVQSAFDEDKYSESIGNKLKKIIEFSVKTTINKQFNNFDEIIKLKIEKNIDKVINEIVCQRLESRVKIILSEQLKQKSLF